MKKYTLVLFVAVATAVFVLSAAKLSQGSSAQKSAKVQSGEVVSVDAAKNEIVIKDASGGESHILISSATKITKEGKGIQLAEVQAGDIVTSECDESADGCKARSVKVSRAKASQ
jgi:hypothetical protein